MLAVEADIAVLLAEDAVLGKRGFDQSPDGRLRRLVGFGDGIESAFELVDDARARAEARQGFRLGGIGEAVEEGAVGQHVTLLSRGRKFILHRGNLSKGNDGTADAHCAAEICTVKT
ncbi:hypothetical protein ABIA13_000542 [Sinorhizobium fredii]